MSDHKLKNMDDSKILEEMKIELEKLRQQIAKTELKSSNGSDYNNRIKLGDFSEHILSLNDTPFSFDLQSENKPIANEFIQPQIIDDNEIDFFVSKYKKDYKIKVIGIGGAGNNIVEHIVTKFNDLVSDNVIFYQINTDAKHLNALVRNKSKAKKCFIDSPYTYGNGAGGDIQKAKKAIREYYDQQLDEILSDCDICIVIAGLGKGTGTGGSTYIVEKANSKNIITLAYAIMPLNNEGNQTYERATDGLYELLKNATAINIINSDDLNKSLSNLTVEARNNEVNNQIGTSVNAIIKLAQEKEIKNIDFGDLMYFFDKESDVSYEFLVKEIKIPSSQGSLINFNLLNNDWSETNKLIVMYQLNKQLPGKLFDEYNAKIKNSVSKDAHIVFGSKSVDGDESIVTILGKKPSGLIHSNSNLDVSFNALINRPDSYNSTEYDKFPEWKKIITDNNRSVTENALVVVNKNGSQNETNSSIETKSILSLFDSEE
ncbi:hypothetical protein [Mycoplasma bradburyae]|uniref:hypothetical protein n=1 Tax=Mycoplasma bradburyae TaxID=2963128 RepID=UPI002340502D|nr:hypothetical protein [Mycoplasma bradburyae]